MKITIGTEFRSTYADSNAQWVVKGNRGADTWNCEIIDCPDYAGTKKVFGGEEIRASLRMADFWNKTANDSDKFYSNLKEGAIVHYHDGFNQYVRCEVNKNKELIPIALVGDWREYDLFRRRSNGEIDYGYHAKKILEKAPYTPHASNVYEYNPNGKKNPKDLLPIDLSIPEETPEQKEIANLWKKIEGIENIIRTGRNENDPNLILNQIKKLIG